MGMVNSGIFLMPDDFSVERGASLVPCRNVKSLSGGLL